MRFFGHPDAGTNGSDEEPRETPQKKHYGNFGDGSVFYENPNTSAPPGTSQLFYQVDLGTSAYIDRVQVLRRTDADQGVFGPMTLTIYQDDGKTYAYEKGNNSGITTLHWDDRAGKLTEAGVPVGSVNDLLEVVKEP